MLSADISRNNSRRPATLLFVGVSSTYERARRREARRRGSSVEWPHLHPHARRAVRGRKTLNKVRHGIPRNPNDQLVCHRYDTRKP